MARILVVDDHTDNLVSVKALLKLFVPECDVITAASGREAIKSAISMKPDTILLDIYMPGMDGFEVVRELKKNPRTKTIPIVMLTAVKTDMKSRVKALELGADAFLTKPINEAELAAQVNAMLRIKKSEDALRSERDDLEKIVQQRLNELTVKNIQLTTQINQRQKAEKALKESEQKFRAIFENAPLGMFRSTPEGRFLEVNPVLAEMLGYGSPDEVLTSIHNIAEQIYVHSEKRGPIVTEKINTTGMTHHQNHYRRRDGSQFIANLYLKTVRNENGSPLYLEGIVEDITQRLEAEKRVHAVKERFQKVFDSQLDAIFILSPEKPARIIEINKAVSTLFGYTKDDLLGQAIEMLYVNGKYLAEFQDALFTAVKEKGYLKDFEFSMKRKNGQIFSTEHTVLALNDETGQRTGWVSIVRDLTERKKFESHIRQTQKIEAIGNLAGGIAHDFNNILFPIVGMSELLLEDLPPESNERENAEEIYKAGKRGSDLVKQILAFSRQSDQKPIPTRIQKVLKEVSKLIRSTIPANIEIKWDIQQDCGMVKADPTQLHQIAMNLITNAYHAVDSGNGKINIQLKEKEFKKHSITKTQIEPGRYAMLSVSDNGCGMDSEILEMIFEPYFTTKEQGKGTGLGLAVVHGIVKEYGGEIFVTSESGKGSCFQVCMPLMKSKSIPFTGDLQSVLPLGTEKILVVDDEISIVKLESQMLERLGYNVTISMGSQEALNIFEKSPKAFDLILTDMTMPNMTGDQLAYEIRQIRPDIPIIICTGFSEQINKEKAQEIRVNGFLMKPIVKSDMAQMIRKILDDVKIS